MSSEILSNMNTHSGLRMSMKRLSQALERCNFGQPISKRFAEKGSRKVFPVRFVSDETEQQPVLNHIKKTGLTLKDKPVYILYIKYGYC